MVIKNIKIHKPPLNLKKVIGDNLRRLREAYGWSQAKMAQEVGCHRTDYSAIERGERDITIAVLEQIALAMNVDVKDLLEKDNLRLSFL